jgi:hypothetical protein
VWRWLQPLRQHLQLWLPPEILDSSNSEGGTAADIDSQCASDPTHSMGAVCEGLTGVRPTDIRALVEKTSGTSTAPGVVTLRNEALAAQATLVTCLVLK